MVESWRVVEEENDYWVLVAPLVGAGSLHPVGYGKIGSSHERAVTVRFGGTLRVTSREMPSICSRPTWHLRLTKAVRQSMPATNGREP